MEHGKFLLSRRVRWLHDLRTLRCKRLWKWVLLLLLLASEAVLIIVLVFRS